MKKLCEETSHDWYEIGKCKDALGKHPCKYFPEGCDTCMTRFECYTKDSDTYKTRISGIFFACKKCPAIKIEGSISEWNTKPITHIVDVRERAFIGLDKDISGKLHHKWSNK